MHKKWLLVALALVAWGCTGSKPAQRAAGSPEDYALDPQVGRPPLNFAPSAVEPETVLLKGATIMTAAGPSIPSGWLLLQDGQIKAVSATPIEAPEGATVLDVTGKVITPGIIDSHSHLGVYPSPGVEAHSDGNEATGAATPEMWAAHSIWPQDPGFYRALEGGVTAMHVIPGSANLIGGRGVTVKSHPGVSSRAMQFAGAPPTLKMACGENPKRVYGDRGGRPSTRMGNMAVWRGVFEQARAYDKKMEKYERDWRLWERNPERKASDEPQAPGRDLGMETLTGVLRGEVLVHVHCYRADEMIQVMQLADEFGFRVRSFHHAVEAYKIRDVLAEWEVSVSTWADWWGFKMEAYDAILENAALIHEAGGRTIIHSDSPIGIQRLNQEAAKALYRGRDGGIQITEDEALRWITLNPAWSLGVDKVTGSIEVGKQADVVVWDASPFSVYARPQLVFVDGVRELDRAKLQPWSDFVVGQPFEGATGAKPQAGGGR